jgi:hypothetical protein
MPFPWDTIPSCRSPGQTLHSIREGAGDLNPPALLFRDVPNFLHHLLKVLVLAEYQRDIELFFASKRYQVEGYTRAEIAAKGIVGKRLTYRRPNGKKAPAPF